MSAELWVAVIGCLLTALTLIVTVTWKLSRVELAIVAKINDSKSAIKSEFYRENEKLRDEVAKTVVPLKSLVEHYEKKHFELELYIRDHYIEVPTFKDVTDEIKSLIQELKQRIEKMSQDSINWRRGKSSQTD